MSSLHTRPLFLLLLAALVPTPAPAAIEWEMNVARAKTRALETNAPMLLDFWAEWCAPCRVMEKDVFTDARIGSAMKKVVPVKIDIDADPDTMRKYGVEATPTLILTDSHGNELFRYSGLLLAEPMLRFLAAVPSDVSRINRLTATLAGDANNATTLAALALELRKASFYRSSTNYYRRGLRAKSARGDLRARMLIDMGQNHMELREFREAAETFKRHLREFKGSPAESEVMLHLARALIGQDEKGDARKLLEAVSERDPGGAAGTEASRLLSTM